MANVKTLRYVRVAGNTVGLSELQAGETIAFADVESHNHSGVYEPADATILKDADIGVTVQAYDATILNAADIGVTVQAYAEVVAYEPPDNLFTVLGEPLVSSDGYQITR